MDMGKHVSIICGKDGPTLSQLITFILATPGLYDKLFNSPGNYEILHLDKDGTKE
jgi:hypothetical protein